MVALLVAVPGLIATECRVLMAPDIDRLDRLDGRALVRTDASVYEVIRGPELDRVRIGFSFRNDGRSSVFVARCGFHPPLFELQKRERNVWRTAFQPVCPRVLAPPVEVVPGETYRDVAVVEAARRPGTHPRWQVGTIPGTYRLVLDIHRSWDPHANRPGPRLRLEERTSNTFRLTGPFLER